MTENKNIVLNYLTEVWLKHNFDAIDEYLVEDYAQHTTGVPPGRDGVKAFFAMINNAFSDISYRIDDVMSEGDKVCWRFTITGKHTGMFRDIPPAGKPFTVTGISIVRLKDGKLAEVWGEQDMLGLIMQIRS